MKLSEIDAVKLLEELRKESDELRTKGYSARKAYNELAVGQDNSTAYYAASATLDSFAKALSACW